MGYDAQLATRTRKLIGDEPGLREMEAFGGLSFLVHGNMSVGVIDDELVVRVGPEGFDDALAKGHARPFDFSGRPMKGWVYVDPEGLASDAQLADWVNRGLAFARSLPPK